MKSLRLSAVLLACLSLIACGKNSAADQDKTGSLEQDITVSSLPMFAGIFTSPDAKIRIYDDGRFALETLSENVHWSSSASEQHSASCRILRKGKVQIVQRDSQKFLRFNISERHLLKPENPSEHQTPEAAETCDKTLELFHQAASLDLWIAGKGNRQFLISSTYTKQPEYIHLEKSAANDLHAESDLYGELSLLFTPPGETTDVTDLVSPALIANFNSMSDNKGTLELSPEFRTIHYVNTECQLDMTMNFSAFSFGNRIVVKSNATPNTPLSNAINAGATDQCNARRLLLTNSSPQELFEITHLSIVNGVGALNGVSFRKTYP